MAPAPRDASPVTPHIPGVRTPERYGVLLACGAILSLLAGVAAADAAGDPLGQLMQQLAQRRHGHAAFVERQFIAILDRPLESSGELFYDAPDRLEKRTLVPRVESLVLDKGMVNVRRDKRSYALALRDYPQVAPFIDSIRATLAGDLAALEHTYELQFETVADDWRLLLTPRDPKLAAIVARIRISGTRDMIHEVAVERADGDRSIMTISPLPGT